VLGGEDAGASTSDDVESVPCSSPIDSSSGGGSALTSAEIYRRDAPAVVVISDTQTQVTPPTFFAPRQRQRIGALGSGFVVDTRGDIVTNEHVVQGATNIRVGFTGGASFPAEIVGTDPSTDIAVVRVHAPTSALHYLAFAGSRAVQVGDPVYAIGNPFGLERTMTAGIVSATGRDIQAPNDVTIPNAIQTDAPINHGNSGGPLLDRFARVVGIAAQIEGGTVDANAGIGFAIPSDTARSVVDQLLESGHAEHPWLGVQIETIDPTVAGAVHGLPSEGVVVVEVVERGPAAKAGLQAATRQATVQGISAYVGGDAIVAADRTQVRSAAELGAIVARHKPGDMLALAVLRGGSGETSRSRSATSRRSRGVR